ncbi:Hypothetical protein ETEE_3975 [Edwardsiella anguillarum ET080813]|uniref:Uncharacterized protein n=1 Tax=Edwardsiella anguillarum ET080813 TaxID=667120 RepID=A0A076LY87_9GAMM|nr:Hypothetical protein ETEE_3975 [Edwardsiella anguillarum ET080813]
MTKEAKRFTDDSDNVKQSYFHHGLNAGAMSYPPLIERRPYAT